MNSKNLHYLYYVEYFTDIEFTDPKKTKNAKKLSERNEELCRFYNRAMPLLHETIAPQRFSLTTVYPGLLVGTGTLHGFGAEGEAALGLTFDYVTGGVYIPSSSVKGKLRSAFTHPEYIRMLLLNLKIENAETFEIVDLETSIFGPSLKDPTTVIAPSARDCFFDAVCTSNGKVLGMDNLTPHRQNPELLELAAPNPLTMLKIRPDVEFCFQFRLTDYQKGACILTAEQKKELFMRILMDLGIGAKTNVGYGILKKPCPKEAEVQPSEPPKPVEGVCRGCGGKTGVDRKTNKYYPYCNVCSSKKGKR